MGKQELQKVIRQEQGFILSDGTLNLTHLLPKCYDLIVGYKLKTPLKKAIESVFTVTPTFNNQYYGKTEIKDNETAQYLYNEDVFNYFNNIAPRGFYFGSHEGDGACIGWFKAEEEG